MQRFIVKVATFLLIVILASAGVSTIMPCDPLYGNEDFSTKMDSVRADSSELNFFFFGSSRIATGLDPLTFDSCMTSLGMHVKSYNMATYGTWFSEGEYLIDYFTRSVPGKRGVIISEFNNVMSIEWDKIDTDKNLYYQTASNYAFIFDYVKENARQSIRKTLTASHYLGSYGLSAFLNSVNLGRSDCLFKYYTKDIESKKRGYRSLQPRDTTNFSEPKRFQKSISAAFAEPTKMNSAYYERILESIRIAKERGYDLYFILTPKNYTKEMATIYKSIPRESRMDYDRFIEFKQLYKKSLWADAIHLNEYGAKRYTDHVASEFFNRSALP